MLQTILNRRSLVLSLALAACLAACATNDEQVPSEVPGASSLSPEALEDLATSFQAALEEAQASAAGGEDNFPGGTAAFLLPDGTLRAFAVGMNDEERGLEMTPDLLMPSGSIGKTYVGATALALAREGRLDLDARIADFFGEEEWFARLPNGPEITVRHLATHTSGLIDHAFDSEAFVAEAKKRTDPDDYFEPLELVELVLDQEPLFAPGAGYDYTDTGFILLGMVIEKAAGATFYDEVRRLFLDPLGLDHTVPADRRDVPNVAQGYAHTGAEFFGTPFEMIDAEGRLGLHPLTEWTGGGFYNNPQSLVRWAKALYEGDAIAGDYVDELVTPVFPESEEVAYGLGQFVAQTSRGPVYGHSGFFPGYNSRVMYVVDHGFAVALQINSDTTKVGEHTETRARVVIEALEAAGSVQDAA
ncbi:MAG: serine hydrolase domain-containing protein [Acidobacteriota bacterium]